MKIESLKCDICKKIGDKSDMYDKYELPVVFTTEQTEGIKSYLDYHEMNICFDCYNLMINKRRIISARSAQGCYEYTL